MNKWQKKLISCFMAVLLCCLPLHIFAEGESKAATITKITSRRETELSLPSSGEELPVLIRGTNLSFDKIGVKVVSEGERITAIEASMKANTNMTSSPERQGVFLTIPENNTDKDQVYEAYFNADKSDRFEESNKLMITVSKAEGSGNEQPQQPQLERVYSSTTEFLGGEATFTLSGKYLDKDRIGVKVTLNGVRQAEIEKSCQVFPISTGISASLTFPENSTAEDLTYKVYFNADKSENFDESYSCSVKVQKKSQEPVEDPHQGSSDDSFDLIEAEEVKLEPNGGTVPFRIFSKRPASSIKVLVELKKDGDYETTDIGKEATVTGEKNIKTITLSFPENLTTKEKEYRLRFNSTGSEEFFSEKPAKIVRVQGREDTSMRIAGLYVNKDNLPKEGGEVSVTIRGENLDKDRVSLQIVKMENNQEIEQPQLSQGISFVGMEKALNADIQFPASEGKTKYKIKVGVDGSYSHKKEITVGDKVSGELISLLPNVIYDRNGGSELVVLFDEPIFAVRSMEHVRESIKLLKKEGEGFVSLTDKDRVRIEGNQIIISLHQPITVEATKSKLQMGERAIADANGREGRTFDFLIEKSKAVVHKAEFLEGEILEHTGGRVAIRLTGDNFGDTKVKFLRNGKDIGETIPVSFDKKTENVQEFSFELPANTTNRTVSYSVRVSVDGGKSYTTLVGHNIYDRTKKLIASVLSEGKSLTDPTLSYLTIQSYGTQGGGTNDDEPDTTHADLPTNQESKKTFIFVYGTNLGKNLTKVRIIDQNGIEWTPTNDPSMDSADQFIMVGFDGTGIHGNGNNQKLEIICPNNLEGDQQFTYQFAVDGKNFDKEVVVTVKVLNDSKPPKRPMGKEAIREISISYRLENGQEIAPSRTLRGYDWGKAVAYGAKALEIENYEVIGYRAVKEKKIGELTDVRVLNETLKAVDEIQFIYKQVAGFSNNTASAGSGRGGGQSSVRPDSVTAVSGKEDNKSLPVSAKKEIVRLVIGSSALEQSANGQTHRSNMDAVPFIQNGRTMLPLRKIAELFGLTVQWNHPQKTVRLTGEGKEILILKSRQAIIVNGEEVPSEVLPVLKNERTYLSVSDIAKALGLEQGKQILWDDQSKEITLIME